MNNRQDFLNSIAHLATKQLQAYEKKIGKLSHEEVLAILQEMGGDINCINTYHFTVDGNPLTITEVPLFTPEGDSTYFYVDNTGAYMRRELLPTIIRTKIENQRQKAKQFNN